MSGNRLAARRRPRGSRPLAQGAPSREHERRGCAADVGRAALAPGRSCVAAGCVEGEAGRGNLTGRARGWAAATKQRGRRESRSRQDGLACRAAGGDANPIGWVPRLGAARRGGQWDKGSALVPVRKRGARGAAGRPGRRRPTRGWCVHGCGRGLVSRYGGMPLVLAIQHAFRTSHARRGEACRR